MKILSAATWYKDFPKQVHGPKNIDIGVVIGGKHHSAIYTALNSLTGKRECEIGEKVEGFLTTEHTFVDRIEAFKIALENDQILEEGLKHNKLYSEFIKH
jgi:hypothetical protein